MKKLVVGVLFILTFSLLFNFSLITAREGDSICCKTEAVVPEPIPKYLWSSESDCSVPEGVYGANKEIVDDDFCEDSSNDIEDNTNDDLEDTDNDEDELEIEDEIETEEDKDDSRELTRNEIKERVRDRENVRKEFTRTITSENGTKVIIERKVESKNGEVKIKIKKTIIYRDGSRKVIEIEMERNEEGVSREIQIEGENIAIDSDLEIDDLFEGDESELGALLSDGNRTRIKVLPERAREIVRERLKIRNGNITNVTLEEIKERNIPRVVYNIESNQNGKFLGVFKLKFKSETQIDPETGEILDVNTPWWAFLVSVPKETEEESNETENSLISYEEALEVAQNSPCIDEGTLTEEHWYNGASNTWWIDMDLEMEGCNPACVVSEETKTAEINYMCTGLA